MIVIDQALAFVIICLATYRAWRLLGADDITEGLRERLVAADTDRTWRDKLYELVTCPWCLGTWLAFINVALVHYVFTDGALWLWPVQALAVATVVGLIGQIDG